MLHLFSNTFINKTILDMCNTDSVSDNQPSDYLISHCPICFGGSIAHDVSFVYVHFHSYLVVTDSFMIVLIISSVLMLISLKNADSLLVIHLGDIWTVSSWMKPR